MAKRKQTVKAEMVIDGKTVVSGEIEGTNTDNLTSKINGWVRRRLINYSVLYGATIVINILPPETDEVSRPDPE